MGKDEKLLRRFDVKIYTRFVHVYISNKHF